jgi:signal transduction histidine kinase
MPSEVTTVGSEQSVEELRRQLAEALETQTAIAAILRVIASSPGDLTPVLSAVAESAARLCDAFDALVLLRKGDELHTLAHHGPIPAHPGGPIARDWVIGRAFLDRTPVQVADLTTAGADFPRGQAMAVRDGFRTSLAIPLQRQKGEPVGAICVRRTEVRPFTEKQIGLLQTFADQAVIAIENARLFEAERARSGELRVALEQQTATAELLKVIGRSTFDLQPVFHTLAENAVRLCAAEQASIWRFDGHVLQVVATHKISEERRAFILQNPISPGRTSAIGRAGLERRTIHIHDAQADPELTYGTHGLANDPTRTVLVVPMLKGELLGVIHIHRDEVQPFTDSQIALMETFAGQAVIAIENARLFEEVQARTRELDRSVRELKSLSAVAQAVSSSLELKVVLARILEHACAMSEAGGGAIYVYDKARGQFDLEAGHNMSDELSAAVRKHPIRLGESVVGQCAQRRQAVQIADLTTAPPHPLYEIHIKAAVRSLLAVPLLHQDEVIGALVVRRRQTGVFGAELVGLLQSFADQSAIALENARLFEEIAQKGRELEIASQHKSQFVANMSHELRTPLAAILGYAELMQEGFYELQGPKSLDALTRIRSNGKHLLGLINTVLDIAKLESGQFSLNMAEYAIDSVVETVRAATESLAQNKKLALTTEVTKSLPIGFGDEQRLTQVLLNLVGNAIKFTDSGEVRVTAKAINGHFAVSVADTGPGIPEHERTRIFEQFHQIDNSNTKAKGGTGLGLAIAKQIVQMHGGRIWVESTVGKGSTFQMELPTRAEIRKSAQ